MNKNRDFEKDDPLLNAVLADEGWQSTNAACKTAALGTFRARQRARRAMRWTGYAVVLAATVACGLYWLGRPVTAPPQIATKLPDTKKESLTPRYLTDAELVASFPKGSCFLAEIDGKKKLVFLDQEVERQFVSKAGEQDSLAR